MIRASLDLWIELSFTNFLLITAKFDASFCFQILIQLYIFVTESKISTITNTEKGLYNKDLCHWEFHKAFIHHQPFKVNVFWSCQWPIVAFYTIMDQMRSLKLILSNYELVHGMVSWTTLSHYVGSTYVVKEKYRKLSHKIHFSSLATQGSQTPVSGAPSIELKWFIFSSSNLWKSKYFYSWN